jgi:hypothetical protein
LEVLKASKASSEATSKTTKATKALTKSTSSKNVFFKAKGVMPFLLLSSTLSLLLLHVHFWASKAKAHKATIIIIKEILEGVSSSKELTKDFISIHK